MGGVMERAEVGEGGEVASRTTEPLLISRGGDDHGSVTFRDPPNNTTTTPTGPQSSRCLTVNRQS